MNVSRFYIHKEGIFKGLIGFSILKRPCPAPTPDVAVQPPSHIFSPLRFMLGLPRPLSQKGEPNTPF